MPRLNGGGGGEGTATEVVHIHTQSCVWLWKFGINAPNLFGLGPRDNFHTWRGSLYTRLESDAQCTQRQDKRNSKGSPEPR